MSAVGEDAEFVAALETYQLEARGVRGVGRVSYNTRLGLLRSIVDLDGLEDAWVVSILAADLDDDEWLSFCRLVNILVERGAA